MACRSTRDRIYHLCTFGKRHNRRVFRPLLASQDQKGETRRSPPLYAIPAFIVSLLLASLLFFNRSVFGS